MNKHHIWASAFAMLALTYGGKLLAQGRLDLAGQWEFQIDRADKGTADKWYDRPLEDRIRCPQYAATFEGRQAVGGNAVDRVALRQFLFL